MLSKELLGRFVIVAQEIRRSHEEFVKAYAAACVEAGGNEWRTKEFRDFFKVIRKELKLALVDSDILPSSVFYKHCAAAEISLIFEIPWSFAHQVRSDDLPEIRKMMETDKSEDHVAVECPQMLYQGL